MHRVSTRRFSTRAGREQHLEWNTVNRAASPHVIKSFALVACRLACPIERVRTRALDNEPKKTHTHTRLTASKPHSALRPGLCQYIPAGRFGLDAKNRRMRACMVPGERERALARVLVCVCSCTRTRPADID